ncbi:apolipoprotein N-acyltransferase [Nitrospira sp.]|nr:apolipoprotein N-acyltransferase [Nitrospira sp.]
MAKLGLALLTSVLLTCSLPPFDWGWIAWVALVPLLVACHGSTAAQATGLGFLSGFGAVCGALSWIFEVPAFGIHHFLLLGGYLALYPALWCLGLAYLKRFDIVTAIPPAALWVILDYVRAHAGFLAFPWGTLAHTQHDHLAVLQVATVTGEYGVTFLVVLGSTAIAGIITRRARVSAIVALLLIGLVHSTGILALNTGHAERTLRVAAVQPSIPVGGHATGADRLVNFRLLERLTVAAAVSHPSLIAWPETAIAGNLRADPLLASDLQAIVQELGVPLVLGVSEVEKFAARDHLGEIRRRAYNSAYFFSPNAALSAPYHKRYLLPFGEYAPFEGMVTWPAWVGGRGYDRVAGEGPRVFALPDGTPFSTLICWESLFSDLSRESVMAGARLLVQLNNPAWFGHSAAGAQQNLSSVLRAVENRVPIVVASNTGPSQVIDPHGRIVASSSSIFTVDMVAGQVPLGESGTVYTRMGDVFVWGLVALVSLAAWPGLAWNRMTLWALKWHRQRSLEQPLN